MTDIDKINQMLADEAAQVDYYDADDYFFPPEEDTVEPTTGFTPTEQQIECIRLAKISSLLKISACAGAAKTTTLTLIANEIVEPSIYLAFNKVTAEEASTKFPYHVTCKTTHSVAYAQFGAKLREKLSRPKGGYVNVGGTGSEIARLFNLSPIFKVGVCVATSSGIGQYVRECVARFEQSADQEITRDHIPFYSMSKAIDAGATEIIDIVLKAAKRLWALRIDVNSNVLATHDTYLKLFQLSKPYLNFNVIYLDEAQDSTPCVLDIVMQQKDHAKIVLVGDGRQSIYQWRGSVNAMKIVDGTDAFLGQSFRYGQAVADVAMAVLKDDMKILGFDKVPSVVDFVDTKKHYTKLFRTNGALLTEAVQLISSGIRVEIETDTKDFVKMLQSAQALFEHDMKNVKHERITPYPDWDTLCEDSVGEPELGRIIRIVKGNAAKYIISILERYSKPANPECTFTTAHKSKGREWDQVVLADDFPSHNKDGEYVGLSETEENLLYVAVTRARLVLQINETVREALDLIKKEQ